MIKVAIIEDKQDTLNYLAALLGGASGISVSGAYLTGSSGLDGINSSLPHVALVDLGLPDISGIDVIRLLRERHPSLDIIVHTLHEDRKHLMAAIKAGATGYILKGASAVEIIQAIENIVKGGAPMSPKIARLIVEECQTKELNREGVILTSREKEVLDGIAKGYSEKNMSERLSLSHHTIHSYVKTIYKKLQVNCQAQAVLKARKLGLL